MIETGVSDIPAENLLRIAIAHAHLAAQHPAVKKDRLLAEIAANHLRKVLSHLEPPAAA